MLQNTIKEGIKEAMKSGDTVRKDTLRMVSAAATNELVAKGKTPQDSLSDEDMLVVLTRLAKQRKDSIAQFKAGGREDLVHDEELGLAVIEAYLPKMMYEAEIRDFAQKKFMEMGITDASKIGQAVGMLMKDLKGKADGQLVKQVAESLLAS